MRRCGSGHWTTSASTRTSSARDIVRCADARRSHRRIRAARTRRPSSGLGGLHRASGQRVDVAGGRPARSARSAPGHRSRPRARAILDARSRTRPSTRLEDLERAHGIGPKTDEAPALVGLSVGEHRPVPTVRSNDETAGAMPMKLTFRARARAGSPAVPSPAQRPAAVASSGIDDPRRALILLRMLRGRLAQLIVLDRCTDSSRTSCCCGPRALTYVTASVGDPDPRGVIFAIVETRSGATRR